MKMTRKYEILKNANVKEIIKFLIFGTLNILFNELNKHLENKHIKDVLK